MWQGGVHRSVMRQGGGPENAGCNFKGVRQRKSGKWVGEIRCPHSKKRQWLGTFLTERDAISAYYQRALELYGYASDHGRNTSSSRLEMLRLSSVISPSIFMEPQNVLHMNEENRFQVDKQRNMVPTMEKLFTIPLDQLLSSKNVSINILENSRSSTSEPLQDKVVQYEDQIPTTGLLQDMLIHVWGQKPNTGSLHRKQLADNEASRLLHNMLIEDKEYLFQNKLVEDEGGLHILGSLLANSTSSTSEPLQDKVIQYDEQIPTTGLLQDMLIHIWGQNPNIGLLHRKQVADNEASGLLHNMLTEDKEDLFQNKRVEDEGGLRILGSCQVEILKDKEMDLNPEFECIKLIQDGREVAKLTEDGGEIVSSQLQLDTILNEDGGKVIKLTEDGGKSISSELHLDTTFNEDEVFDLADIFGKTEEDSNSQFLWNHWDDMNDFEYDLM
ncbi:hypothetical protein R1flu_016900 [Riccia fluitans]|uniref:AP2/ERF domain-containing protein n=1 Tax=Riccia fluitans TaxID=41844 RepID=A0ABD1YR89_9MARC